MEPFGDLASVLDSPHARQLAGSQLVPVLMTLMLHAKDISQKPLLPSGAHELLTDFARVCIGTNASQWSTDDQIVARAKAEALLTSWIERKPVEIVTGLRGPVIGRIGGPALSAGSERENTSAPNVGNSGACLYCGRENNDPTLLDYCSSICAIAATGEGA